MAGSINRMTVGALVLALALGSGCERDQPESAKALLFPTLSERQVDLDRVQLTGAGNVALVTLSKKSSAWRVAERQDWPADEGRLSQYLFVLSQTHRIDAKTANPKLYPRLGVEPVSGAAATGTELSLSGPGISARLLIGHEHAKFNSNYVRIDGQPQSWLTDLPVTFDRDPASWLDRRLIDLPLARIAGVHVSGGAEKAFSLSHRDDRFRLDDAPSAAMHDSYQGDAMASVLDQLKFEDVAADDGSATIERELRFDAVDGTQVTIQAWHVGSQLWVRVATSIDEAKLLAWIQLAGHTEAAGALRNQVADWNRRFHSQRFLVPAGPAATLMLTHEQILAGAGVPGA